MEAIKMKTSKKYNHAITINIDDALYNEVQILAEYYQRKNADLLRLLLTPVIIDAYAKMQREKHPENKSALKRATFRK